MTNQRMISRRGLVLTGGGAKGLFEAGVLHAFHITGMEFDIITGSSIGAFNAIFYAEYLLKKKNLPVETRKDPDLMVEAMDCLVKAYHHAWLQLPQKKLIDDSPGSSLHRLKDDLLKFNLCLPDLARLAWWWTDPDPKAVESTKTLPSFIKLVKNLLGRFESPLDLLHIIKSHRKYPVQKAIRTYLAKFQLEKSLIPTGEDHKLSSMFTQPIEPLQAEYLSASSKTKAQNQVKLINLVESGRTLGDYAQEGIDVRLTRANYRTGRLELSAFFSLKDFVRYLDKQAFRLEKADPDKLPLGSFRLHLPGDPDAISAALASGRFPGVLAPFPIEKLYPLENPRNEILRKMLETWLENPEVETAMTSAYLDQYSDEAAKKKWQRTYTRWKESLSMRNFFPRMNDVYVDGGAIDNTPSNSAIDATREWAESQDVSKRDLDLDLYIVFLEPEPTVNQDDTEDPALHQVVSRTLKIQGAAKQSSDAVVVDTINTFGQRAEVLGDTLNLILKNYENFLSTLDSETRDQALEKLLKELKESDLRGWQKIKDFDGILALLQQGASEILQNKLPLQINQVSIYPETMPMSTLQFTERMGYRQENAIQMLTSGCYNTLWAIYQHLSRREKYLNKADQDILERTMKWMGIPTDPKERPSPETLQVEWKCQRTACVYHKEFCPKSTH